MKDIPLTTEQLLAGLNQPLPFDQSAEEGVLSCLMQHPARCEHVPSAAIFYHPGNAAIANAILTLHAKGPVDPILVTRYLRETGQLDKVGGAAKISEIYAYVPIAAHFPHYLGIVEQKFRFRQMIAALAQGIHDLNAFNESAGVSAIDTLANCQKAVCEAANDDGRPDLEFTPIKDLVLQVIDDSEARIRSDSRISGLSTGIEEIDNIIGGLEPGGLTVIAAESSDGKSSLCRQILEAVCVAGHAAVDYTYEMQPKAEARRILCSQGRIDGTSLKQGLLTRGEQMALGSHAARVIKWDMAIVDVAGKTIEQICRDISRRAKKLPPEKRLVVMIDYIQLCKTAGKFGNREREVAHITATAKQCAKMTGAHIIMPSQVNTTGEVRESMAIEQDCDNLAQIQKIKPAQTERWKTAEPEAPNNKRRIFWKKVRDGERYQFTEMELVGRNFRFEVCREVAA